MQTLTHHYEQVSGKASNIDEIFGTFQQFLLQCSAAVAPTTTASALRKELLNCTQMRQVCHAATEGKRK